MKITCPACGSKYAIADDKVRGRRVKVRCKSCSEPIIVDGYAEPAPEAAPAPPASYGGAPAQQSSEEVWSVNLSDTDQRSMTTNEIVDAFNQGMLADAYVWKEGMGDWTPLASAPDLAPYLSQPSNPLPQNPSPQEEATQASSPFAFPSSAARAAPEPARVAGGRAHGRADLFGGFDSAGSEEEALAAAASAPPSSSDARMTGARNENSVLFSLDALKAGVDAAPAKAASQPARQRTDEKASLDDIMSLGGGNASPLFSMHANQALLAAPPPPPEPPPRPATPSEAIISSSVAPPMPQKSNRGVIIAISGAIAAVAILAVVLILVMSKGDKGGDDKVAKEESGQKSDGDKKSGSDDTKSGSGDTKSASTDTTGGSGDTTPAAAGSDPSKPVTEEEKKRFAEAMKKKEEEDKKNGKDETKKEEEVKTKDKPSSGVGSFDKGAAIAALSGAAAQASGCKRPGGPTGGGKAIVTFAASGRVTSANVTGGDFPGTPVGSCVASVFRRASVPAFSGDAVTVSKSFRISP